MDGIDVLRRIKGIAPQVEVIMLTGHSTLDTAMRGLELGAYDYLTKPCGINELRLKIKAAHERRSAILERTQKTGAPRTAGHPTDASLKE
jgi:DNA-binding response OmpR family regulator